MIDHSPLGYIFIRTCIALLQYAPILEAGLVLGLSANWVYHPATISRFGKIATYLTSGLLVAEVAYILRVYRPHKTRLLRDAKYPEPLNSADRKRLFDNCQRNILQREDYLRLWFLGAGQDDIRRDNVKEFLLWAFFDKDARTHKTTPGVAGKQDIITAEEENEVDDYVKRTEELLGRPLAPGRADLESLRLTINKVDTRYRSVLWYGIVSLVDFVSHVGLRMQGFRHYAHDLRQIPSVFPPRIQALLHQLPGPAKQTYRSASGHMGYWLRPHTSKTRLPIVFLHGIGIGLWPYIPFLGEVNDPHDGDGQVGVLALELLPYSMRHTSPPLAREDFLLEIASILDQQGPDFKEFVLVSHSYGSVLTTHMIHSPVLGPRVKGVVLVDPVSILLHLPNVAYNFTRRQPRTANEWQLWFFASMDLGIAEGLGRHFFWRENIIWKEELTGMNTENQEVSQVTRRGPAKDSKRKVAVLLSGQDLIVDTKTVARYLSTEGPLEQTQQDLTQFQSLVNGRATDSRQTHHDIISPLGIAVSWFPFLDHAQIFEHKATRKRVLDLINDFNSKA